MLPLITKFATQIVRTQGDSQTAITSRATYMAHRHSRNKVPFLASGDRKILQLSAIVGYI